MRRPGTIVTTATGRTGIVYKGSAAIEGRVFVNIVDPDTHAPVMKDGKPEIVLCKPENLQPIGFVD